MQIKFLQYIFYALMCLPILVLGFYFFVLLCKDIKSINEAEKQEKALEKIEQEKRRVFDEKYYRKRNG